MTTYAVVRFTVPGFHRWPDAPEHRAYLRNEHRHLFHVEVAVEVTHDDREIEFHDLQKFCRHDFMLSGPMSCEMACKHLHDCLETRYPKRKRIVSVFEDGEVGAMVL